MGVRRFEYLVSGHKAKGDEVKSKIAKCNRILRKICGHVCELKRRRVYIEVCVLIGHADIIILLNLQGEDAWVTEWTPRETPGSL